jgi:indolepyruvate ferredoxin oxidoreductase
MSAAAIERPSIDGRYTLEHKYMRAEGRIYLSSVQALVRLPLMQQVRDRAAGINTAAFISGYRVRRSVASTSSCGRRRST